MSDYLIVKISAFFFIFLINTALLPAQDSRDYLVRSFENEVILIDKLIEEEKYDEALAEINELEKKEALISSQHNKLEKELRKSKAYYGKGNFEKAMSILLKGIDEIEERSVDLKIEYSQTLAQNFKQANNFNKSRYHYKISKHLSESIKDTLNIIKSYLSIGLTFYEEDNIDSAVIYSKKAINFPITEKTRKEISNVYNNLSVFALSRDSIELALQYGTKSLDIIEKHKDSLDIAVALINLGNILYKKNDFYSTKDNYFKAYKAVQNIKTKPAIRAKENLLYNLAYVNEELNDFEKAYKFLEEATDLTDSLANANIAQNISEIEAKYNFEKQTRIAEEEKRKRSQAQALFYGTALTFIAILALGYIFYRNYRLKQQNKLDQLENQTQTKIINATIDAKEKERKAIAETLHDSVSALLSSANLHLQATKAQLKQKSPQEITKAQTIVNEASVKIRDLSHELISSVLLKFGLAFAVHDMCQKYSNSEITLHSDDDGIKRYHQDFEIKIHNIIEELINNILKHSKAANATVMLAHKENDMLSVRISDDGVGFNPKSVRGKDGLGLSHIEARIKVMKGVFNIISSVNEGTNIFMLVPIQFKEQSA